jgi:hypothetical protein
VSAKVCLRCDWSGQTDAATCPRCGTSLYASPAGASEAERAPSAPTSRVSLRRAAGAWIGVLAIVALAAASFVFVQRHTVPAASGAGDATHRDGYLLVPVGTLGGGARLWVWDLTAATATSGPTLRRVPERLVESVTIQDSWIGITTRTSSGERTASVVRDLTSRDEPIVVARGRSVGWSASAGYVTVARSRPLGGCRYDLDIFTWFVTFQHGERAFDGRVCGEPVALDRDRLRSYVELRDGSAVRIAQLVDGSLRTRLRGLAMLSVSPDGDLLVQADGAPIAWWSPPADPVRVAPARGGLVAERVLAWSADAEEAYVLGSVRGVRGVYQLTAGPALGLRLVEKTSARYVEATATPDGVYVVTDGNVRRWVDGTLTAVPLPVGMPTPEGPILWISALPYSPPGG